METRHAAYSLAYKTGAIFRGHFGGKNPRLIAEEIRYVSGEKSYKIYMECRFFSNVNNLNNSNDFI